ncbi:uncharacterized protein V6R79_008056 [Siganus canaliculatus]
MFRDPAGSLWRDPAAAPCSTVQFMCRNPVALSLSCSHTWIWVDLSAKHNTDSELKSISLRITRIKLTQRDPGADVAAGNAKPRQQKTTRHDTQTLFTLPVCSGLLWSGPGPDFGFGILPVKRGQDDEEFCDGLKIQNQNQIQNQT